MDSHPLVCDTTACDAGIDAALETGADTSVDAPASGCVQATVAGWVLEYADDVSISYLARITPTVGGRTFDLHVLMERYGDAEYVGTFPLGTGRDANRSTCAHCIAAYSGTTLSSGYFVDRGTLVLDQDPFGLVLQGSLTDVRLIEVTIAGDMLESVPVPGGGCIELAPTTLSQHFAPEGWTCPVAQYGDGASCDCNCGVFDADCDGVRPEMGCAAGTVCETRLAGPRVETFCAPTCSRALDHGCVMGVCAVDGLGREFCNTTMGLRGTAAIGEHCADGATYCAPVGTSFFDGVCDIFDRNDQRCRATCTADTDCNAAALEHCYHLFGDSLGLCSLRYPLAWGCPGERYMDGATCDCGCGTHDPDCDLGGAPLRGCAAGEVCTFTDACAPIPANDTCGTAIPLTIGHVTGTTLGATNDYSTVRPTGCIPVEEDGPDVVYTVDLAVGQTLGVRGIATDSDVALYLIGPGAAGACDAMATHCVAGIEATGYGEAEMLAFTATTAGTYFLIVDSFSPLRLGAFALDVTRTP